MIRSYFGLQRNPFDTENLALLEHQQQVLDILRVHAQQGGLCLVLGEPGTGKSVLKQALVNHDPKRMMTPVVNRTLHTYHNTLRILCEAFQIEFQGRDHHCERLLVQEAFRLHRTGKMLVPIIDDAHLMQSDCLRKLRLLFEDFPHSQLDRAGLGHNTFSPDALALIVRSAEGLLRRTRNLCLSALIEAVRDQVRAVELKQVNRVLIQPHWRNDCDQPLP